MALVVGLVRVDVAVAVAAVSVAVAVAEEKKFQSTMLSSSHGPRFAINESARHIVGWASNANTKVSSFGSSCRVFSNRKVIVDMNASRITRLVLRCHLRWCEDRCPGEPLELFQTDASSCQHASFLRS